LIIYFIMLFTSGASFPAELFPESLRRLTNILPLTHAVTLMKSTFAGRPLGEERVALAVLFGVLGVCGAVGAICYRRRRWG
jgi:ABC-type polysaccharide/polyol phosphate export permease